LHITRHCLKATSSLEDFNAIVGANDSKVFLHAVHTAERALAALLEMEGRARVKQQQKRKEKKEKVSEEEENEKEIHLALLKGGLSLSAECLKADPALLQAHLPNLFLVLRLVLTNCCSSEEEEEGREGEEDKQSHPLSSALNEALACILYSLLYLHPAALSPLLGSRSADDDSTLLTSLRHLLKKHKHDPPPSLASMVCNIYGALAGCSSSSSGSKQEEEDAKNSSVPALLARLLLDGDQAQDPALIKEALFALQEYVWACPQVVLSQLRSRPDAAALQARLEGLVESGAVEGEYLACVLKGKNGVEEDETLLETTPIKTADWLDYAGLGRSVVKVRFFKYKCLDAFLPSSPSLSSFLLSSRNRSSHSSSLPPFLPPSLPPSLQPFSHKHTDHDARPALPIPARPQRNRLWGLWSPLD
jgi:hypothetical protein